MGRHRARQQGEPPQLWNGLIMEDPADFRMGASTPALCKFMRCFWLDGRPRDSGNPFWDMRGSWDNATTAMVWRPDGINIAWSFNGRKQGVELGESSGSRPLTDSSKRSGCRTSPGQREFTRQRHIRGWPSSLASDCWGLI